MQFGLQQRKQREDGLAVGVVEEAGEPEHADDLPLVAGVDAVRRRIRAAQVWFQGRHPLASPLRTIPHAADGARSNPSLSDKNPGAAVASVTQTDQTEIRRELFN
jgi:hypothetical protein